jgi:ATP-dependent DNA ligase
VSRPPVPDWVHDIEHDGFRIIALRSEDRVRLFSRNNYDFAARFPKVVAAVESLMAGAVSVHRCPSQRSFACAEALEREVSRR